MVGMTSFFLGNWVTRLYSIAVIAALAFMVAANPITGPSVAAVFLIGLTAPVSVIFAPFFLLGEGWMTTPMLAGGVLAGYLLNTVLLNMIVGQAEKVGARRA
jgi:hypothetical protein